ncbi:hypothetical protein [Shewanella salipaludis]|uniref:Uncharacterized protein n=1 Tax=Shewanella salipaludis TaxID=2723052 RepID=A0A972JI02_9GAMM|nr:hypothetical protein [Shewanella salipaludis]NMH63665.1 hypothetical protein [Shewanella salipaludis]
MSMATLVDIPFDKRHTCWFCGEPSNLSFEYPAQPPTPHPSLTVPACKECLQLARKHRLTSIWDCRMAVKDDLLRLYAKHLAIGINWTPEELAESEFSCKILSGFRENAWMMYEIARDRVNAPGWPLSLDGVLLDDHGYTAGFSFDGLDFRSVNAAINHYGNSLSLDKDLLAKLLGLLGRERFGHAVRLCRMHIGVSQEMKRRLLQDIAEELASD